MALDPRILLAGRPPDVGQTFSNILSNFSEIDRQSENRANRPIRTELLEANTSQAQANLEQTRTENRASSLASGASEILDDLKSGRFDRVRATLINRKSGIDQEGLVPSNDTDEALAMLDTPEGQAELLELSQSAVDHGIRTGTLKGANKGLASAVSVALPGGGSRQIRPDGSTVVTNRLGEVVEGQERIDLLESSAAFELDQKQKGANIEVQKARDIGMANLRATRASDITREMSKRGRDAARAEGKLNEALALVNKAEQGFGANVKLQAAKLFPGIDVQDEAVLDQAFKQLAMIELQAFSGPTTDFEFGVSQDIAGSLGDGKSANLARVNSLKRANWFNAREADQFRRFVKGGGDPDVFKFNFGETITTKGGRQWNMKQLRDTAASKHVTIEQIIDHLNGKIDLNKDNK